MAQKRGVPEDELPLFNDWTPLEYRFPLTMVRLTNHHTPADAAVPLLACMRLHLFRALLPFDMSVLIINGGSIPKSVRNAAQVDGVTGCIDVWRSNKDYAMMDIIPHYDIILGMPGTLSSRVFEYAQRCRTLICDYAPRVFRNDVWYHESAISTDLTTPTSVQVFYSKKAGYPEAVSLIGYRKLRRTYDRVDEFLNNPDFLEYS